jgi:hypothetical protein
MLDVIFVVCALANPNECQTLRAETDIDDNHIYQCLLNAEQTLAKYVTKDYFIKSFGCTRKSKDT